MSFALGLYDVISHILPGMIYLFTINEFLKVIGVGHLEYSELSSLTSLFGVVAGAYLFGFTFRTLITKLFFEDKSRIGKKFEEYIKGEPAKYGIEFSFSDLGYLYMVMVQRNGDITRNYVDRLNAYNLMFHNLVGNTILVTILQITKMIVGGLTFENIILVPALALVGFIFYRSAEHMYLWWCKSTVTHAYAYGNNLETFLANDQPRWDYSKIKSNGQAGNE